MGSNGAAQGQDNYERRRKWHRPNRGAFTSAPQAASSPCPSISGPNHHLPTTQQLHANRDAFHFLCRQIDDALIARERFLLTKEEEIGRREQEIYDQERLIESLKEEVSKWKAEASYYAEKFLLLKNRLGSQNNETADRKGESGVAHRTNETQLPVSEDHSRVNPSTLQMECRASGGLPTTCSDAMIGAGGSISSHDTPMIAEGACSGNSIDYCISEDKKDDDLGLASSETDGKYLSVTAAETDIHNCFDSCNAANEGSSDTNSQPAPCHENTQCSGRDVTKEHPSLKLQVDNNAGPNEISELQIDTALVNGETGIKSSAHVLPFIPVKVKVELNEGGPIDTFDSDLARHVIPECSSSEKHLSPQIELGASIVNTEKDGNDNHHGVAALSIIPAKVKIENAESGPIVPSTSGLELLGSSMQCNMPLVSIKCESLDDLDTDEMDHISLHERTKLLLSRELHPWYISTDVLSSERAHPLKVDSSNLLDVSARGLSRRKKRTATTSVETALEEDAPGLLQILLEKGLRVDEIKLYGDTQNDDGLYRSSVDDNFAELETVISKMFSRPSLLLKLAKICHKKGSKTGYCLACLVSLIEQARYLQLNKWSVEWGWCRDLYSFIFVFERHNRIVLERPEYGYATYFFELLPSLPIDWQIRRLITAMKLTSCSRSTLIEDRPLVVGEDLSEDEARILEEYGWRPNSGLGTMLNYCDRVVHDYKTEDTNEWRSKIGKLLMNGYDQGTPLSPFIPKKVLALKPDLSSQLKLEL